MTHIITATMSSPYIVCEQDSTDSKHMTLGGSGKYLNSLEYRVLRLFLYSGFMVDDDTNDHGSNSTFIEEPHYTVTLKCKDNYL